MVDDVQLWCRVRVLSSDGAELADILLEGQGAPDLGAVDEVARLALLAGRLGGGVVLAEVSAALDALLHLAGLAVEVEGQAELAEEPLGAQEGQEKGHPGDLPIEISSTCSAHGVYPPAGSGRYWPKAGQPLAEVGTRREPRQPLGPGSSIQRPMSSAPDPHGERRHRLHGVVVQQRHQPLDVVALEGVHVAFEQLGVGAIEGLRWASTAKSRRPGPVAGRC